MPKKKGGLGRGLDVFFGDDDHPGILEDDRSAKFIEVPITEVRAGRYQPRTQMYGISGLLHDTKTVAAIAKNRYFLIFFMCVVIY